MPYLQLFFALAMLCVSTTLPAQTALIQHKSHSGSSTTFAAGNTSFDHFSSNFGIAPEPIVETARLDSVIYLNDSMIVMVTTEECRTTRRIPRSARKEGIWRAGRDTVYGHLLFQHAHRLDSIRMVLDRDYHFVNPASETVFMGYDNTPPPSNTRGNYPPQNGNQNQNGQNPPSPVNPNGQGQQSGTPLPPKPVPPNNTENGNSHNGQSARNNKVTALNSAALSQVGFTQVAPPAAEFSAVKQADTPRSSASGWWLLGLVVAIIGSVRWWWQSTVKA